MTIIRVLRKSLNRILKALRIRGYNNIVVTSDKIGANTSNTNSNGTFVTSKNYVNVRASKDDVIYTSPNTTSCSACTNSSSSNT